MNHSNEYPIRLNKFISHRSKYSRREADELIKEGHVKIGHTVVTNPSTNVQAEDAVRVKNRLLKESFDDFYTVIAYNKPKGEIVSKKDPQGRTTIYDSIDAKYKHFLPIGRLDYASEGLLLLTDSPMVADILMKSDLTRVYNLKISGSITTEMEDAMINGIKLDNARKGAHAKTKIISMDFEPFEGYIIKKNTPSYSRLGVKLKEGKNRELRRFFGAFDRDVLDLKRVSYGWIELNALPTGKTRYLGKKEYEELKNYIKGETKNVKKIDGQNKVQK
jgi:23S rRNA pseudouridine2605 synthase